MNVFNNLNKNIFDINSHASSNSINFTSLKNDNKKMANLETSSGKIPSYSDLKKQQKSEEDIKALSSNNLVNVKPKPKPKPVKDPLSYISYSGSKNSLKKISDPLSQMKPTSTFGYPTKNKTTSNTKTETNTQKESIPLNDTNVSKETNTQNVENTQKDTNIEKPQTTVINPPLNETTPLLTNTNNTTANAATATNIDNNNIKVTNTALMSSIFGNYSNLNINNNMNANAGLNNANATTNTNLNNSNPLNMNQNLTANNQMMNNMMMNNYYMMMNNYSNLSNNIPNNTSMTNTTNMTNMTNLNTNMTNLNTNMNFPNMMAFNNQNINYQNMYNNNLNQQKATIPKNTSYKMPNAANTQVKKNELRNELNQLCKLGDLYTDTNFIREKCGIMKCEKIKDLTKASFMYPEKRYMGVLVLTDFRLIFQIENENNLNYNYSEDYFKFPLFNIIKIEKVQDKKMSYDAYPMEVSLKDTRVIKFHVWDQQRFYYNLSDIINPRSFKVWYIFAEEYNNSNFRGKNITNGWNIYDPVMEFSRQGVTEDNDLGLRYCYVNKDFSMCPSYPKFLIEPKNITDEELRQSSSYRTKGRLPIFSYYYNGNIDKNLKGTPSIWRSAQNKRGIIGNKTSASDIKLLNIISKMGGKLFIYDCRPKLNALVNRVNGGGYENVEHYDNVTLHFCEIDNIHKARKALSSLYSLCLSNKINDYNNFWTNLEQSGWFQFIYLMLKNANEISKILQNNNSVLIHCSDGWDRTAQLSSLSQMLLDPFYRTINGFAILVEKDWLSFGHQFALRNGFADKEKQDQASPIFLQFLDAVHQLLEQFPNAFEFNEKFLLFLAKNYNLNLYGTFMYNNEKERTEANARFNTASVWTEIFKDLKPYLNVYYDPNSVKILEPNYSYYNLKIWTSLFMENNIYLENKQFYISDLDKNLSFKSKQEFFAYKKKEDENKFMNYQLKYEELLKVAAETYFLIKDNNSIFDKLSEESKKLIEELKPKLDKINKSRLLKQELLDKLKGKKDNKKEENNENVEKEEEKKEEDKKEGQNETKEEINKENNTENEQKEENVGLDVKTEDNANSDAKTEEKVNENEEKREENNDDDKKDETNDENNENKEGNKEGTENEVKPDSEQVEQ